jgi:hypothetical protein
MQLIGFSLCCDPLYWNLLWLTSDQLVIVTPTF